MTEVMSNGSSLSGSDSTDTANKILKNLIEANKFDKIFEKLRITFAGDGKLTAELVIEQEHTNIYGFLHGGFTASLVDFCGSVAMGTHEKQGNGVSVDLNIAFLNPGPLNEIIIVEANTLKVGRTLGFAEVIIRSKASDKIIAKGSLTKHVQNKDKYSIAA